MTDNLISYEEASNFAHFGIHSQEDAIKVKAYLDRCCFLYYTTEHNLLSNDEYDDLNDAYEDFTGEIVSGTTGTTDMAHGYDEMMSTLKKIKVTEELTAMQSLRKWIVECLEKVYGSVSDDMIVDMTVSHKMDGNSIMIEYNKGAVVKGVTRGKDGLGCDITHIFKSRSTSEMDQRKLTCGVKFEAILANSIMPAVSEQRGKEMADPRSAMSGILSRDNGAEYNRFVDLAPIDITVKGMDLTRQEKIKLLHDLFNGFGGYISCDFHRLTGTVDTIIKQMTKLYEHYTKERAEGWDYMIDGMVIEFLDEEIRETLGWHHGSSTYPKFARAIKYPPMQRTTTAIRMEYDVGATGRITPCVVFKPITINGRTFKRTSIANYARFQELKAGKGTRMMFTLANDVLGYLDVLECPENEGIVPWEFAENCPTCSGDLFLNDNETFAYCTNEDCPSIRVGRIHRWIRKLGLKGIGESILEKLLKAEIIEEVRDLYELDQKAAYTLPGLGHSSVNKFVSIINSKRKVPDYEVLAVAGPEGIGRSTCKPVCQIISLREMVGMNRVTLLNRLIGMPNIQEVTAEKIIEAVNSKLVKWALSTDEIEVTSTVKVAKPKIDGGESMKVCVTGKLNSGTRDELVARLEEKGHSFVSGVTKNTDLLVTNDPGSGSDKNKKAKLHGVRVVSEQQCIDELGL
jgi:DNA ligase (NAD+)